jgi:hypothetical protein
MHTHIPAGLQEQWEIIPEASNNDHAKGSGANEKIGERGRGYLTAGGRSSPAQLHTYYRE